ncbi:MAG: hypothetical protein M0T84_09290 [Betaproteobacteria bacterium]|nr:hypothetical protein [Betaproteobacteria bacterium]
MSKQLVTPDPAFRAILNEILDEAGKRNLTGRDLAVRSGITPESLSRMKKRGHGDWTLVNSMAKMVGKRLALVPDDDTLARLRRGAFFDTGKDAG